MATKSDEFQKRLLAMFHVEAEEHLEQMTAGLLELENTPTAERQMTIVENVFREAHSLKGAARSVKMSEVEALCQSLETVFARWKHGDLDTSSESYDGIHHSLDSARLLLAATDDEGAASAKAQIEQLSDPIVDLRQGPVAKQDNLTESERVYPAALHSQPFLSSVDETPKETVRIATGKLDVVLLQAEELLSVKLATSQHAAELKEINAALTRWKREWAKIQPEAHVIRRGIQRNSLDGAERNHQFSKIAVFLDWNLQAFTDLEGQLAAMERSAQQDHRALGAMVDEILGEVKNMLMLPFGSILATFPRLVRGLSRDQAKEIALVIEGGEVEVDRRILEEMKDPLIHLIRNCIDHGIEKPEEREQNHKPRRGIIKIAVSQQDGSKVQILISDDGRGIDRAKIRDSALKLGVIMQQEANTLSDPETLALIFRSGVSSSPIITDLSGRGLGLAIVREKAEKLRGRVSVESQLGEGTIFHILLPLTIATFRGIPVRVDQELYVLPSASVERVVRVKRQMIRTVENKETIELAGETISLVGLGDVLGLPQKEPTDVSDDSVPVVQISQDKKRIAFLVDEIINEQEVLVKPLGRQLSRVRNVAGATILANRKLVPVLNISDLMHSAIRASSRMARGAGAVRAKEKPAKKSVLVVEDSITARSLLKGILESAGYNVDTAVDGVDGLTQLRSGKFDVVVSDVEMPRMNGFDLTAKIRGDNKLAELPVILVTARQTREDRERGMDVGANAYIVKSSFDQSNLLELMERFT